MIILRGLGVKQAKVDALQKTPTLIDVLWLWTFLKLLDYYQRFVKDFNIISKLLTILTSEDQPWTWDCEQKHAFNILKQKLDLTLMLWYLDANRPFQL